MNTLKTSFLMVLLTVLLVAIGYLIGHTGGMLIAFGLAVVLNGGAYWFSDRMALSAARAQEVAAAEAPMLHALADRLAQVYGVPRPRVYISPDPSPNAFATGRNPRHAAICVNRGLLRILDERQLFGVLAHEFAHVGNRDILISSVAAVMAGAITILANMAQWSLFWAGGRDNEDGGSPLGLIAALLSIVLAPIAATLIQLAISRSREFEADRVGAARTGDPLALASALRALQRGTEVIPSPVAQPAFAHLYIANPLNREGLADLFSTHPPMEERIRRLEEMAIRGPASGGHAHGALRSAVEKG
jgi:heat shock protein HtpX